MKASINLIMICSPRCITLQFTGTRLVDVVFDGNAINSMPESVTKFNATVASTVACDYSVVMTTSLRYIEMFRHYYTPLSAHF